MLIGFTWGGFWLYLGIAMGLVAIGYSISLFAWYRARRAESAGRRATARGAAPAGTTGYGGRVMPGRA